MSSLREGKKQFVCLCEDVTEKDLPAKADEVKAERIFTTAIYNSGTVIFGSTNVQVNNQRDDIEGLLRMHRYLFASGTERRRLIADVVS